MRVDVPTLIVPLRASPVLTATAKPTVALPVPLGVARVIQGTFAVPVHAHAVVSVTDPPPAVAGIPSDTGLKGGTCILRAGWTEVTPTVALTAALMGALLVTLRPLEQL